MAGRMYVAFMVMAALAAAWLYRPAGLFFLADDFIHIPSSIQSLIEQRNSIRPIGNVSLYIDHLLYEKSPAGYHLTNLLLHLLNSCLTAILAWQLTRWFNATAIVKKWLPFSAGLLFFTYSFHAESVFWVIGRSGSLGALFSLTTLILILGRKAGIGNFLLVMVSFQLALWSYESSWIIPILVTSLLFISLPGWKEKKSITSHVICLWLLLLLNVLLRVNITGNLFQHYDAGAFLAFDLKTLAGNFSRLIGRTLLPPFVYTKHLLVAFAIASIALIILVVYAHKSRSIDKTFWLLVFWWLVSYLPYLSLGIDTHGVEGGRYLYLPAVFFLIWFAYLLLSVFGKRSIVVLIVVSAFHVYHLSVVRSYYTKAGDITRETYSRVCNEKSERIFIENLPQYNRGAVVFRIGFEEGLRWLCPQMQKQVVIVSIDDSDVRIREDHNTQFSIQEVKGQPKMVSEILGKDTTYRKTYARANIKPLMFIPGKDVWFRYSDSMLVIEK